MMAQYRIVDPGFMPADLLALEKGISTRECVFVDHCMGECTPGRIRPSSAPAKAEVNMAG
jgi:hypothetical protein